MKLMVLYSSGWGIGTQGSLVKYMYLRFRKIKPVPGGNLKTRKLYGGF